MSYAREDETLKPLRLGTLRGMKARGEKLATLTAYDATFARLLDRCGVEVILVGDSLGNVVQGRETTLPVTLEDMAYHTACVARGARRAFVMADLPFGSYQEGPAQAMRSAAVLMAAGAAMVKVEGGAWVAETVRFLVDRGVPVCAHLGLTPQTVHALGGYRVQGRDEEGARALKADAAALSEAGASFMVLEMVPAALAAEVTASLPATSTIGIGGGPGCDGQILVLHDLLGLNPRPARFVKDYVRASAEACGAGDLAAAIKLYVREVKEGAFPGPEHGW